MLEKMLRIHAGEKNKIDADAIKQTLTVGKTTIFNCLNGFANYSTLRARSKLHYAAAYIYKAFYE